MTLATLTWLTLGAVLVYIVAQDPNVYTWLVLLSKNANIWVRRRWFMFWYNPSSPWIRYKTYRNAARIAREIIKENENR